MRSFTLRQPTNFYPRPPRGGRHLSTRDFAAGKQISIHALREEGDLSSSVSLCRASNFYPRPPRGGRPLKAGCGPPK